MYIGFKEDLRNEFKSDRNKLSDADIIDVVVAFANTEGGALYIGVEDDGEITGLHPSHRDEIQLAAFIANKTVPPVSVIVEKGSGDYVRVTVPKCRSIIASSSGKLLRRRIKSDNTPENVPMYPHEISSRLSDLRLLDFSAQCVPEAVYEDLDDIERERLRRTIRSYHGEQALLELDNEELDKALRLVDEVDGRLVPTFAGMLLIGRSDRLKLRVPTAGAVFQVLSGTNVVLNESLDLPILAAFERISAFMDARNPEEEIEDGLYRISVSDFSKRAVREAVVNAFCHRDYTMLGRIRILMDDDGLSITNPGGFIEGVTFDNLLTVEPQGRNPALADALKRIGLAERTGRGIDRIFEGSLLYGKPLPDYSESNEVMVKLFIPKGLPDRSFTKLISDEQKRTGQALPINTLLILSELKRNRRATLTEISAATHISDTKARVTLGRLVEAGLVEAAGSGRNRHYTLNAGVYKDPQDIKRYVHQAGKAAIGASEHILKYAAGSNGRISRKEAAELLNLSESQAYRLLRNLADKGQLRLIGKGKYAYYKIMRNEE